MMRAQPKQMETLIPIAKMKGELNGKFEAFYLAMDKDGQLFINHNPPFSRDRLNKSAEWEMISRQQLDAYEKQLHLIPIRRNGIKR